AAAQVAANAMENGSIFFRSAVTHRVWNIKNCRTGFGGGFHHVEQKADVAAARVLGGKLNLRAALASIAHPTRHGIKSLLPRNAQLCLKMQIGCRQKYVQARPSRRF